MTARLRLALLFAVPLVSYASAPWSGFVWDDHKVIERGRLIGSLANVPKLFTHDTMFNSDGGAFAARATVDTYRPLTLTTFFVERALFGVRAAPFHVDSVLLHLACVLLCYVVARKLSLSTGAALFGALLFAAHPAISEGVHWIDGRSDPLCVALFLLALWAWLDGRTALTALAIFAATLSKETAFVLAPTVVLLLPRRPLRQPWWRALLPWVLGGGAGLIVRMVVLHRAAVSAGGRHLAYALERAPLVWLDGLRSLAVPLAQMPPSLHERYRAPGAGWMILAVTVALALAALAAARWRRGDPIVAWAVACLFASLAPIALLSADEGWFGWGRYLYPAAPAFALAVAAAVVDGALPRLSVRLRRGVVAALGALVLLCAAQTLAAGRDWRDDRSFAEALVADHPESSAGWCELASVELRADNPARALVAAERATELAPRNHVAWSDAASALMRLGRRDQAYAAAARALALDGSDNNARYLCAIAALEQRREDDAAHLLLDALAAEPDQPGPWQTLSQALAHLGPHSRFAAVVQSALAEPRYASIAERLRASSSP
jgi:protein O-mannosyl-transferase